MQHRATDTTPSQRAISTSKLSNYRERFIAPNIAIVSSYSSVGPFMLQLDIICNVIDFMRVVVLHRKTKGDNYIVV